MGIVIHLDRMMTKRHISLGNLAKEVGITDASLSKIKNNKVHSIRFSTLTELCKALDCQPSDLLEYIDSEESDSK
ncbi:helix-turn-helix domain-containing protein [Ileibacterium valens]|uniref:helix-turn-helix domain-containing protein n=1 Tax=Ileibacterium valens TaxID=1862668 RepID=UPI0025731E8F|nr:helix-turn-helix transcriptional regulator [Ileibacterium valens]